MSGVHAAAALYSTVQDRYRWDRALYGETVLESEWKEKMFAPHAEAWSPDGVWRGHYGYGWLMLERKLGEGHPPVQTIYHPGGIFGFSAAIVRFPESGHLIVLLNNTGGVLLDKMTEEIVRILYTDH